MLSRDEVPPSLTAPCAAPVTIPERDISGVEVEIGWGRDRAALRDCAQRHAALVKAVGPQ